MIRALGLGIVFLFVVGSAGAVEVSFQIGSGLFNDTDYQHKQAPLALAAALHGGEIGKLNLHPEAAIGYWRTFAKDKIPVYWLDFNRDRDDANLDHGVYYYGDSDWEGVYAGGRVVLEETRRAEAEHFALWPAVGIGINQHWSRDMEGGGWKDLMRLMALVRLNIRTNASNCLVAEMEAQFNNRSGEQAKAMDYLFRLGYRFRAF